MKSVLAPLMLFFLLASCATYRLQPLAQPGSEVRKDGGQSLAVADHDGVVVQASARWAPEIEFTVKVVNNTGKSLKVDSDKFRLFSGDLTDWRELYVIPSDEYYQRAEDEVRSRPVVTITSSDAPVVRRTTTTTTTVGGNGGSLTIIRTEQQPVVEPVNTRTVTIVSKSSQRRLDFLKDNLFYSATLEPGKDHDGLVYGEIGRGTHYKLVVPVDGKDYTLVFQRVKDKSSSPFTNLD